jgi:phage portal protein BeeE
VGWLKRRRDVPAEERANLFAASGRPPTWLEASGGPSLAGMQVTEKTAMGMPAVSAAVRLLCETIAQLPLNVYRAAQPTSGSPTGRGNTSCSGSCRGWATSPRST